MMFSCRAMVSVSAVTLVRNSVTLAVKAVGGWFSQTLLWRGWLRRSSTVRCMAWRLENSSFMVGRKFIEGISGRK